MAKHRRFSDTPKPDSVQKDEEIELVEQEITKILIANLSIYKCPRQIIFIDEMPLTATGKLQRFILRKMAENSVTIK